MAPPLMQLVFWLCNIAAATHIIKQNCVLPHPAGPAICKQACHLLEQSQQQEATSFSSKRKINKKKNSRLIHN